MLKTSEMQFPQTKTPLSDLYLPKRPVPKNIPRSSQKHSLFKPVKPAINNSSEQSQVLPSHDMQLQTQPTLPKIVELPDEDNTALKDSMEANTATVHRDLVPRY